MARRGLRGCRCDAGLRPHQPKPDEADLPNVLGRELDGHAPHAHVCSDLACVRVGAGWRHVRLPIGLHNRETVGHAASGRKDAALVMAAFATVAFALTDMDVFRADRGGEFDNAAMDEMPEAFGITRSLSKKG